MNLTAGVSYMDMYFTKSPMLRQKCLNWFRYISTELKKINRGRIDPGVEAPPDWNDELGQHGENLFQRRAFVCTIFETDCVQIQTNIASRLDLAVRATTFENSETLDAEKFLWILKTREDGWATPAGRGPVCFSPETLFKDASTTLLKLPQSRRHSRKLGCCQNQVREDEKSGAKAPANVRHAACRWPPGGKGTKTCCCTFGS